MSGNFLFAWMPFRGPPRWPCQVSSMLTYVQPWRISPDLTIARAERSILSWSTASAQQFQLFQPKGGVRQICSPITMRKALRAEPRAFLAPRTTL